MQCFVSVTLTACVTRVLLVSAHRLHHLRHHIWDPVKIEPLDAPVLIRTCYCKPLNDHSHSCVEAVKATFPESMISETNCPPSRYEACNPTLPLLYECNELWPGLKIATVLR
jgi:hypothetical protein